MCSCDWARESDALWGSVRRSRRWSENGTLRICSRWDPLADLVFACEFSMLVRALTSALVIGQALFRLDEEPEAAQLVPQAFDDLVIFLEGGPPSLLSPKCSDGLSLFLSAAAT